MVTIHCALLGVGGGHWFTSEPLPWHEEGAMGLWGKTELFSTFLNEVLICYFFKFTNCFGRESEAHMELTDEKNVCAKISCYCPFELNLSQANATSNRVKENKLEHLKNGSSFPCVL